MHAGRVCRAIGLAILAVATGSAAGAEPREYLDEPIYDTSVSADEALVNAESLLLRALVGYATNVAVLEARIAGPL